jgi:hypothetical protein
MPQRNDNGEAAAAFYAKRRVWREYVCEMDGLSDRALRVGFWISSKIDAKEYCWHQHTTIAKALGISVDKVARAILELEDRGVLIVVRKHRKPNEYSLRLPFDIG